MEEDVPKGLWTDYHPTGKPSAKGERVGVNNEGPWQTFWSTGEPWREVEYVRGRDQDDAASTCGRLAGVWSADGEQRTLGCLVCRARPEDQIELVGVGVWTYWHPSGGIEKQGALVEGKQSGEWVFFHDNGGVMMRGHFDGGVEIGAWSGAYRTGQPRFEGAYADGLPDQTWTSWSPDGGVMSVGRYVAGKKVGEWKYERAGQLVSVDAGW
jgi:antitoxin component YwqK of YwqJK toxin-antitoxin module